MHLVMQLGEKIHAPVHAPGEKIHALFVHLFTHLFIHLFIHSFCRKVVFLFIHRVCGACQIEESWFAGIRLIVCWVATTKREHLTPTSS